MKIIRINKAQGHWVFELFDKYRVFYKKESDIELAKKFVHDRLDNNESVIFVALSDGANQPIGFTQLYPKYSSVRTVRNWILNDLYVEQEYRRQGIGAKLIQTAIDFAKQNGAAFVELSTAVDNYTTQRFYDQTGFRKADPETDFFTYRIDITE